MSEQFKRPHEIKSNIIQVFDRDAGEPIMYVIKYPLKWSFEHERTAPVKVKLWLDFDMRDLKCVDRFQDFIQYCEINNGYVPKVVLKTAGLTINVYELKDCQDVRMIDQRFSIADNNILVELEILCLYYHLGTRQNYAIRWNRGEIRPDL